MRGLDKLKHLSKFILVITLFLLSCNSISQKKNTALVFFDAAVYFNNEIKQLEKTNPKVEKEVLLNDLEEKKTLGDIDWKKELATFINTNINKPAVYEYYEVDSLITKEGSKLNVLYKSISDKMEIKQFEIFYDEANTVEKITAVQKNDNLIFQSSTYFEYVKGQYYKIEKKKKLLWFAPDDIKISAKFLY